MDKLLDKLAYSDFVSYVVPGCISLAILLGLVDYFVQFQIFGNLNDVSKSLAFIGIGYFLGVMQSEIAYWFDDFNKNLEDVTAILNSLDSSEIELACKIKFFEKFPSMEGDVWTSQHFFIMRSYVQLKSPDFYWLYC